MTIKAMAKQSLVLLLMLFLYAWPCGLETLRAGQHSESAPHRCVGCASGNCSPQTLTYGHHQPQWRKWPGATTYKGYRRESRNVDLPAARVPDAVDEGRIEKSTRSDRPIESQPSSGSLDPQAPVPGTAAESAENPFNTIVDETEIPATNDSLNDGNNFDAGPNADDGLQGLFEPNVPSEPPAEGTENLFPGAEAVPSDDDATPGGFDTDIFNNSPIDTPDNGADREIDFGLIPPKKDLVKTSRAIRSIKNRRPEMKRNIHELTKPAEIRPSLDLPQYDTIGGGFSAADLTATEPLPQPIDESSVIPVSYEQETDKLTKNSGTKKIAPSPSPVVWGNPLRNERIAPAPDRQPRPVPAISKPLVEETEVTLQAIQAIPQPTESLTGSTAPAARAITIRAIANVGRRSIRESLRRNPLR